MTPECLEDIALFGVEVDMPYAEWYDRHAAVYDLEPGQMLHWPLNAPHRVENLDTVNISMTISYTDEQIRRLQMINFTNGLIRHQFGYRAKSRAIYRTLVPGQADPAEAAAQQRLDQARAQGAAVGGFQARRSQARRHRRSASRPPEA